MSEEINGKLFSITWLFWPGLILIFIALILILNWSPPEHSKTNTKPRVVKEYTPPTPKKPIYQPLPKDKPKAKPNLQPLPDDKPKIQSNLQPLPKEKSKKPQSNYQPLKEVDK